MLALVVAPGHAQTPDDAEASGAATPSMTSNSRGLNPGFDSVGSVSGVVSGALTGALATLSPQGDPGVSGQATLLRTGTATIMTITLSGLAPNAVPAGALRAGGCDGPLLFALEGIQADGAGHGRSTTTLSAPIDTSAWWLEYRADPSPTSPTIACGQVIPDR
jgi:hypothetical protein